MAKLNDRQRVALDEYLVEKKPMIVVSVEPPHAATVASWAREVLKFDVDTGNITSRVGTTGKLYYHVWPGSEGAIKGRNSMKALNLLLEAHTAQQAWLKHLYNVLVPYGFTLPKLPKELDPALVAKAQEELAETDQREDEEK
jgi:hypothetical protein